MLEIRILQSLIPGFMPLAAWQALGHGRACRDVPTLLLETCDAVALLAHGQGHENTRVAEARRAARPNLPTHSKSRQPGSDRALQRCGDPRSVYERSSLGLFDLINQSHLSSVLSPCQSVAAR
jgi:hypothetical protein